MRLRPTRWNRTPAKAGVQSHDRSWTPACAGVRSPFSSASANALAFVVLLLVALAALFPLRLATGWMGLDERGLAAREIRGSVWRGRLAEARFAGLPLGDLRVALDPLSPLTGTARLRLTAGEGLTGAIAASPRGFGIEHLTTHLPLDERLAPLPVVALDLTDVSARFRDGLCLQADGRVEARLAGDMSGLQLGTLSGSVRCDDGALLLPLVSRSGTDAIILRLSRDRRFHADIIVRPSDPAVRDQLVAGGFRPGAGGLRASVGGKL